MKYQITSFYEGKCQQLTPQVIFHLVNLLWRELYKPTKRILYKEVNKTVLPCQLLLPSLWLSDVKLLLFLPFFPLGCTCNVTECVVKLSKHDFWSLIFLLYLFSLPQTKQERKDKWLGLRVSNKEQKDNYSNVHVLFLIYTISWGGFTCLYSKFKYNYMYVY